MFLHILFTHPFVYLVTATIEPSKVLERGWKSFVREFHLEPNEKKSKENWEHHASYERLISALYTFPMTLARYLPGKMDL
jgi:hypothetical protein